MDGRNEWAEAIARDPELHGISRRQAQMVRLAAAGQTEGEIGAALGIAPSSVAAALTTARLRLGLPKRPRARHAWAALLEAYPDLPGLTERQRALVHLLAGGASGVGASIALGCSVSAVSNDTAKIRKRLPMDGD